jgi:hypothetical protein
MAWLSKLDARARHWPKPLHWSYLALKWYLVIGGAVILTMQGVTELGERRVGIGTGFLTLIAFTAISHAPEYWRRLTSRRA